MARIGVIEKDIRKSLAQYKQDGNLLTLLRAIATQSDCHIRYNWQYDFFMSQLTKVYDEVILKSNENPSHREGKVNAISSR
jgi:hypothetical protein